MGLLDSVASQVLGSSTQNNLLNEVMGFLGNQQSGGLAGLVQQFSGKGLGDIVNSWVSTGQNLPITPQQLEHGLGAATINQLASKTGLPPDQLGSQLSQLLPNVIDKLTPGGQMPQGDIVSQGMDLLKGFLK